MLTLTFSFSFSAGCISEKNKIKPAIDLLLENKTVEEVIVTNKKAAKDSTPNQSAKTIKITESYLSQKSENKTDGFQSQWPMFRQNCQRTGESPLTFRNMNLELQWVFKPSEHTFSYREGTNLWSESAIAIDNNGRTEIIVGSYDHKIYCLNASNGNRIWTFNSGDEIVATPIAGDENIVFLSSDRSIYGLNSSGKRQWIKQLQKWTHTSQPLVASSPVVFDNLFSGGYYINDTYFFDRRQEGYAFLRSSETNEEIWTVLLRRSPIYGPAIGDFKGHKILFFTTSDGIVCAINGQNGQVIWKFTADQQIRSTPVFSIINDKPTVLISARWGMVWAINGNTGKALWSYRTGHMCDSSLAIADIKTAPHQNKFLPDNSKSKSEKIILSGSYDRCLHGIYASSSKRAWKFETKGVILSSPAIAQLSPTAEQLNYSEKIAFFSSMDNYLYCVSLASGRKLWSFKTGALPWPFFKRGDAVFSSPLICNITTQKNKDSIQKKKTMVIFPCHDGKIYAFASKHNKHKP